MKAIVLREYGGPEKLSYEDVADPVAGEGQVLVRVTSASINPVDYKLRSGAYKSFMPLTFPAILGNDFSGLVREVGAGVTGFAPGDKVMGVAGSSYAELVAANADAITKVPEGLDPVEAAALPVVTMTGEQLIRLGTRIQKGQTVLVTGALGGVGRSAIWTAKKTGAVVIAGVRGSQVKAASVLGADQILALDDASAMEKLGFVDAVADVVGGPTGEKLLGKVKPGGIFASVLGDPANAKLHPTIQVNSVVMHPDAGRLRTLADDVATGRLVIPIDRMVPLDEVAQAHAAAEKGGVGKILLLA